MIPKINPESSIDPVYLNYFNRLKDANFLGDIEYSYSSRLAVATDNSVYQRLPQGVIFPKNRDDVVLAVKLASEPEFAGLKFAPPTAAVTVPRATRIDKEFAQKGNSL